MGEEKPICIGLKMSNARKRYIINLKNEENLQKLIISIEKGFIIILYKRLFWLIIQKKQRNIIIKW